MRRLQQHSKQLSWLLRHGAREAGLPMDEAGWAPVDAVLRITGLTQADLTQIVQENGKRRLQLEGARVRACQGHSTEGTPVRAEALEASWERWGAEGSLWHGTSRAALPAIAREGLSPRARTHVHLAATPDSPVGKRAGVDLLLEVDAARLRALGIELFASENGVVLCRVVPPSALVGLLPCSAAAVKDVTELRGLFGF